jgi:uridine kinase
MEGKPFIIGITGGSASGKTLFLKNLMEQFQKDELCLISQDNYYRTLHEQPKDQNGVENFDTPDSIDRQRFHRDLEALINGESITKKEYTFNNPEALAKEIVLQPAPIIIVEGIFVFYYPEIAELIDLKIFIDAKEAIKLKRRIKRDQIERGYDIEDVLYRYEYHVSPTYERYIEPLRHEADLVVPNNYGFDKAMKVIVMYLQFQEKERHSLLASLKTS